MSRFRWPSCWDRGSASRRRRSRSRFIQARCRWAPAFWRPVAVGYRGTAADYSPLVVGGALLAAERTRARDGAPAYSAPTPSPAVWPFALQQILNGIVAVVVADADLATMLARHVVERRAPRAETASRLRIPRVRARRRRSPSCYSAPSPGSILADRQESEGRACASHEMADVGGAIGSTSTCATNTPQQSRPSPRRCGNRLTTVTRARYLARILSAGSTRRSTTSRIVDTCGRSWWRPRPLFRPTRNCAAAASRDRGYFQQAVATRSTRRSRGRHVARRTTRRPVVVAALRTSIVQRRHGRRGLRNPAAAEPCGARRQLRALPDAHVTIVDQFNTRDLRVRRVAGSARPAGPDERTAD